MSKINWKTPVRAGALALFSLASLFAQEPVPPQKLTLKQAVTLAVENSPEVALARVRQNVAEKTAAVDRAASR